MRITSYLKKLVSIMIHMTICIRSRQKKRHVLLTDPSNADKISQPESNVVGDLDISRERYQYHKRDLEYGVLASC